MRVGGVDQKSSKSSNEIIIFYKNLIHFLNNIDFIKFFDHLHQLSFKFIDEYTIRIASPRRIEWFNRRLKILNIHGDINGFVYRLLLFVWEYTLQPSTTPPILVQF